MDYKNSKFYNISTRTYPSGLFDSFCDAAYVLTLTTNNRILSFLERYNKTPICSTLHIVYNKGYQTNPKYSHFTKQLIEKGNLDLEDCETQAFIDSKNRGYNEILIFEDDCILTNLIKFKPFYFLLKKWIQTSDHQITRLGAIFIPTRVIPTCNPLIWRSLSYSKENAQFKGTHGYIISRNARNKLINFKKIDNCLVETSFCKIKQHVSFFPLAVQSLIITENMKSWDKKTNKYIIMFLKKFNSDKTRFVYWLPPFVGITTFMNMYHNRKNPLKILKNWSQINSIIYTGIFSDNSNKMFSQLFIINLLDKTLHSLITKSCNSISVINIIMILTTLKFGLLDQNIHDVSRHLYLQNSIITTIVALYSFFNNSFSHSKTIYELLSFNKIYYIFDIFMNLKKYGVVMHHLILLLILNIIEKRRTLNNYIGTIFINELSSIFIALHFIFHTKQTTFLAKYSFLLLRIIIFPIYILKFYKKKNVTKMYGIVQILMNYIIAIRFLKK
jgi:hypothetical protein